LSVVARLLTYGVVCAAVMTLRRKQPQANAFRLPGAPIVSIVGLIFVLALVTQVELKEIVPIVVVMAIALLHWMWAVKKT
jgi:basic amino acid/polyamine antiporter, APA family